MQKILLAMNALNINNSSIDFATYIANKTRSKITAVFLEQGEVAEAIMPGAFGNLLGTEEFAECDYTEVTEGNELVEKNKQQFKDACAASNVGCTIHYSKGVALDEILKESRFADLIITDVSTSVSKEKDGIPSNFVKDLLADAECPVIISPFEFDEINEVIFTYDGSESSVFAIKQFSYLFPEFEDLKITLIEIVDDDNNELTEKEKIKEWLMMRYNAVHIELLHGEPEEALFSKYLTQRNKILIMGAYGRKIFLKHSTADLILKTLDIPVFIAHH
ncbi:hypothetical protein BH10BAC3_BH10BAC3_32840 [soil metagenome]